MNICSRRGNEADFLENGHNRPPPHQAVRKLRNGILEERKKGSRTPRRQRKRAISKLWRSFFQGRRLARSFRTVCHVGGYGSPGTIVQNLIYRPAESKVIVDSCVVA